MPSIVEIDGIGEIEFGDEMSEADISKAVEELNATKQRATEVAQDFDSARAKIAADEQQPFDTGSTFSGWAEADPNRGKPGFDIRAPAIPAKMLATRAREAIMGEGYGPITENTPIVPPRIVKQALGVGDTAAGVTSGLIDAAVGGGETFATPFFIGTMGTGALPAWAQRLVSLGFTVDMIKNAGPLAEQFGKAYEEGDTQAATKALGDLAVNAGFAVGSGLHAAKPSPKGAPVDERPFFEQAPESPPRIDEYQRELNQDAVDVLNQTIRGAPEPGVNRLRKPIITPYSRPTVSSPESPIITPPPSVELTPAQRTRAASLAKRILLGRGVDEDVATEFSSRLSQSIGVDPSRGEDFRSAVNSAFDESGLLSPKEANTYSDEQNLRATAEAQGFTEDQIQAGIAKRAARDAEIRAQNQRILKGESDAVNEEQVPTGVSEELEGGTPRGEEKEAGAGDSLQRAAESQVAQPDARVIPTELQLLEAAEAAEAPLTKKQKARLKELRKTATATQLDADKASLKKPDAFKTWSDYDAWLAEQPDDFILSALKAQGENERDRINAEASGERPQLDDVSKIRQRVNVGSAYREAARRGLAIPDVPLLTDYTGAKPKTKPESREVMGKDAGAAAAPVVAAPVLDLADQVAAMTGPEFSAWAKAQPGGFTTAAYEYGKTLTPEQQAKVREASAAVDSQIAQALAAEDAQAMSDLSSKKQFFNEALEAASGATLAKTKTAQQVAKAKGSTAFALHTAREFLGLYKTKSQADRASKQHDGSKVTEVPATDFDEFGNPGESINALFDTGTEIPKQVGRWLQAGWTGARKSQTVSRGGTITNKEAKPVETPRTLDTSGTTAYGSAFHDQIPAPPILTPKEQRGWWTTHISSGGNAKSGESQKTVVLRNTESPDPSKPELREVSAWDNNGEKIIDPDTGKATTAFNKETKRGLFNKGKWVPVVSLRHAEALKGVNRPVTVEELSQLREQYGSAVQGVPEVATKDVGPQLLEEGSQVATLADQPSVAVLSEGQLRTQAKESISPEGGATGSLTKADAEAIINTIGQPQWKNEAAGKDVVGRALASKELQGFIDRFTTWIVDSKLDPSAEWDKLVNRTYESLTRNRDAVVAGTLAPSEYRARVLADITAGERPGKRADAEGVVSRTGGEEAEAPADRIDELLTRAIEATDFDPTQVNEGILGAPVWIAKGGANAALRAARAAYRIGKDITVAIAAGIEKLRGLEGFNEQEARAWIESELKKAEATQRKVEFDEENPPLPDEQWVPTNVQGQTYYVRARDQLTPETARDSLAVSAAALTEAGFKPELRTFTDPADNQTKSIHLIPKTENADAKGRTLAGILEREIATQRAQGKGLADHVAALINSVRENFDRPDSAMADMSESVRNKLFALAQEEASFRGRALRALRNFRFDVVSVGRNVDVYLNRFYSDMFGGAQVRAVMDRVGEAVRRNFNETEVQAITSKLENPADAALLGAAIRRALAGDFGTAGDVTKSTRDKLVDGGMTEAQADKVINKIGPQIEAAIKRVGGNVAKDVFKTLSGAERAAVGGKQWKTVEELIRAGVFDDVEALKKLAARRGWRVPTKERIEEMKRLADKELAMAEPSERELAATGGDKTKMDRLKADIEGATRERRFKIQKRLAVMWSEMTLPTSISKFWAKDVRANNARFINELISANLLFRASFLTRQFIDISTQWAWRMPFRAMAQAMTLRHDQLERPGNLRSQIANLEARKEKPPEVLSEIANLKQQLRAEEARPIQFWADAQAALQNIYKDSFTTIKPALIKARAAFAGRVEVRNVDRLMSSVSALDRLWQKADSLAAQKDYFGAFIHRAIATVGFSYRIAGALDFVHGLPAEWNHRRFLIIQALRNQGVERYAAEQQADWVMDTTKAELSEAVSMTKSILEARGEKVTDKELLEDAWSMIERRQFQKINELGLPEDAIREDGELYRNTLGWNEAERRGLGGLVGLTVTGVGRLAENVGIPLAMGRFGNAIAIGINRQLQKTALYALSDAAFLPGQKGEASPWFRNRVDVYERRLEAAAGSLIGGLFLGMAWMGLAKVWLKPPTDKEERDLWDREGHKAPTVEFSLGDGKVAAFSLNTGPLAIVAPYLAAGGALNDLSLKQEKAQKKLNEEAARLGVQPGQAPGPDIADYIAVAGQAAQATILGSRTASGWLYSVTDYGTPNIKKLIGSQFSPVVPGLPAMQEVSRMAGTVIDPKKADLWDYIIPLPTSPARKVNMMGDPVGTQDDVQRVFQILSGGSYPVVDTNAAKETAAYRALYTSGYRPPSINPAQGYQVGNDFRPLNDTELAKYTELRGKYLKQNLGELGPEPTESEARAAYNTANRQALSDVGVTVASTGRAAGGTEQASAGFSPRQGGGVTGASLGLGGVPRRTSGSRLGLGGSRIQVTAGSLRPRSRLGGTRLPRIRAPRVTRVSAPRVRTRRARRNRLRR